MDSKKTVIMVIGVISGMVFVYGLDVLTAKLPAELGFDFLPWKILRYSVTADIDSLTVMDKEGKNIPIRSRYGEEMDLNCYYYHTKTTGRPTIMMELISRKIKPESITVDGRDETAQRGPGFARRLPAPWYVFLEFKKDGSIEGQRRTSGIRDMIVSTYYTRRVPKGKSLTRDTWSGEVDMGPFITTYSWRFDGLKATRELGSFAEVSGSGEFFAELPAGGRGEKLGSYTYSYALDLQRDKKHIVEGKGSFDLKSRKVGSGTAYREEFEQKLVNIDSIPSESHNLLREQFEILAEIVEQRNLGDYQAFHDGLYFFLLRFQKSPLWNNIFILLNDLREKCGEKPMLKEEVLEGRKPELKKEKK